MLAAFVEQAFDLAGGKIDALDRAADIFMRFGSARHHGAPRRDPAEPAIVADIAFAVGSDRRAIGAAGNFRDHLFASVGPHPRQPPAADFDQHHRSVRHHHRPFRKFEIGGEHADIGHEILPAFLGRRRISSPVRTRNNFVARCYGKVDIDCQAISGHAPMQVPRRGLEPQFWLKSEPRP